MAGVLRPKKKARVPPRISPATRECDARSRVKESDPVEIEKESEKEDHPQKLESCEEGGSALLFPETGDEEG